jgi:hypothetical protein
MVTTEASGGAAGLAADAVATFGVTAQAFERAAGEAGLLEYDYRVARLAVRLRFAGATLVPLFVGALSHLAVARENMPDLTVSIWNGAAGTSTAPALPSSWWAGCAGKGGVHTCHGNRIHSAFHASSLSMLDSATGRGLHWVGDASALTASDIGSPLLRILHWWLRSRGIQVVHGGAIGIADGGVLLAGRGGAGKSTTCLVCLEAGLAYAGDDYCSISEDPTPHVHSLYCTGKVEAGDLGRFAGLRAALFNRDRLDIEKAVFLLHKSLADRLTAGFPLRAILVPRVSGRADTVLTRVPAAEALLALAPSTVFQLPGAGPETFSTLARVVRRVPTYRLDVGTDLRTIPPAVRRVLEEHPA